MVWSSSLYSFIHFLCWVSHEQQQSGYNKDKRENKNFWDEKIKTNDEWSKRREWKMLNIEFSYLHLLISLKPPSHEFVFVGKNKEIMRKMWNFHKLPIFRNHFSVHTYCYHIHLCESPTNISFLYLLCFSPHFNNIFFHFLSGWRRRARNEALKAMKKPNWAEEKVFIFVWVRVKNINVYKIHCIFHCCKLLNKNYLKYLFLSTLSKVFSVFHDFQVSTQLLDYRVH